MIGGMSWVSTGIYYDRINRIVQRRAAPMASAPMLIESLDFAQLYAIREDKDWKRAGEVLCETVVSAISPGTELAAWRGDSPLRPGSPYPRVQGYCNLSRVIAVGERRSKEFRTGEHLLTLQSHRSHFVMSEAELFCRLGSKGHFKQEAVSAYLFHLGYNAVLRSGVRAGHRVVVIGLGALGLTSVAMASLAGADVHAVTNQDAPSPIARKFGALGAYDRYHVNDWGDELAADVVILTTNSWEDLALAQFVARQNATIACLGFPGRNQPPGDYNPLAAEHFYNKQLRIEAVGFSPLENDNRNFNRFNVRENLDYIRGLIAQGRLDPNPILSGRYPAAELAQAYADLDARKDDAITYLLDWSA